MSLSTRIFYNTLAQSLGKLFAAGLGLVTTGLLSQHLAEQGFGQYSTVVAFLGLFAVAADLGLYLIVVREISRPSGDHPQGEKPQHYKIISNALGLRLTASILFITAGAFIALLFPYDPIVKQTMFVGIAAFLFVSLNQVLIGIFQKHLVQHLVVIAETVGRAINLVLVYLFIAQALTLPYFILAMLVGNAGQFLLTWVFARRYERFDIAFDFSEWKIILTSSWPLIFAVILNLLYFKTDTVILSYYHSEEVVGIYGLPYRILEGLLAFPAMFVGLIMPLLSRAAFDNWEQFKKIFQQALDAIFLMAVPMVVSVVYFAEDIIEFMKWVGQVLTQKTAETQTTTSAYADSPDLLRVLILSAATIFFGTLFGYAVVAVNKQRAMIKGYLAGAVLGLGLYFGLIPNFGYWGAAWGTLATELVVAAVAYYLVSRESKFTLSIKIAARALPGALGLILFFHFLTLPWILELALGLGLYIILLIMFRVVPMTFVKDVIFSKISAR